MRLRDTDVWMLVYFADDELPQTSNMLWVASWCVPPSTDTLNRAMLVDMHTHPFRHAERYSCVLVSNVSEPTLPPEPVLRFR